MKLCTHELKPALARGEIILNRVHNCIYYPESQRFDTFVDYWMAEKIAAEKSGDKAGRLFAKLVANSAYGKFAQNPREFKEYCIRREDDDMPGDDWELWDDFGAGEIYRRPNPSSRGFFDVAIAASITSASRAILAHALSVAVRPIYCDTDSIICESLPLELDAQKIGAWKLEATGKTCFIAGKKLYALFADEILANVGPVKWASKGVRMSPEEIARVALGETVTWRNSTPTMKVSGKQIYLTRNISPRF